MYIGSLGSSPTIFLLIIMSLYKEIGLSFGSLKQLLTKPLSLIQTLKLSEEQMNYKIN